LVSRIAANHAVGNSWAAVGRQTQAYIATLWNQNKLEEALK
jgi:hypothetical protein